MKYQLNAETIKREAERGALLIVKLATLVIQRPVIKIALLIHQEMDGWARVSELRAMHMDLELRNLVQDAKRSDSSTTKTANRDSFTVVNNARPNVPKAPKMQDSKDAKS